MKNLLLSIITLVFVVHTNAQEGNIQIGAKAGLNLATLTGDLEGAKTRTSFHLGGMAEIPVTDKLSVQPELLFSSQGAKDGDASLVFNYLNVPIMGKYYVTNELSLEAGPQIGYLLSANLKFETADFGDPLPNTTSQRNAAQATETEDVKNDVKSLDFGLNIGLGYKMDNGLNFGARYNLGLADANNIEDSTGSFMNGVFQISVGYFLF